MNDQARFAGYTQRLRQMFPTWTRIRKDPNAVGSQFLNVIGLELDEVDWMLNYAYEQVYIGTADLDQVDVVYKARVPNSLTPDTNHRFFGGADILEPADTEEQFLLSIKQRSRHKAIQRDTACYVDYENKVVYVQMPFEKSDERPYGQVILNVIPTTGDPIIETLPLVLHSVWNFFDEFGLLLGEPRNPGERNTAYKERLLDVFRRPANASEKGLINGVARALGLIYDVEWLDGTQPLILRHANIDTTTIMVDNVRLAESELATDIHGRIVIPAGESGAHQVRYIAGVTLHELHDKMDERFQAELYNTDGSATDKLRYYAGRIRDRVPAMWGQFRWGEGHWDVSDESYAGFSFIQTLHDGRTDGFKKRKEVDR